MNRGGLVGIRVECSRVTSMMQPDKNRGTMQTSDDMSGMQSTDFRMQGQMQSSEKNDQMQSSDFRMWHQLQSSDKDQMQSSDIMGKMQSSDKGQTQLSDKKDQMHSSNITGQMQLSDMKDHMQSSDKGQMQSSDKGQMQSSDFRMQRQMQSSDKKGQMQSSNFRLQRQVQSSDKKDQMQSSDFRMQRQMQSSDKKDQMQSSDFRMQRQVQSSDKKDQMQSSDFRMQRQMQSSDKKGQMQSSDFRMQRQVQSSDKKGQMQSSDFRMQRQVQTSENNQMQSSDFRMQQGRGHGNIQPRNDNGRKMQAARKQGTKSNRSNNMGSAKNQAKPVKRLQLQRRQNKAENRSVGRGKALETMLDTIYEPIFVQKVKREQKNKEVQYVLVDESNKVEYIGVLEECPDVQAASVATPDHSDGIKEPHEKVAQVLHLERSPPRPYREIPETYPGVHGPPAPYGYGPYPPHPPPWFGGGYYGYYPPPPDPMAMDYWRPSRPPPPEYYRPRGYRPKNPSYYFSRCKNRPLRFSHRGYKPHGYSPQFPSPYASPEMQLSPHGVQIKELRSPGPNQVHTGSEQRMSSSNEDAVVNAESLDQQQSDDVIIEETYNIPSEIDGGIVQVAAGIVQQVIDDALMVSEKAQLPSGIVQGTDEVHVNPTENKHGADEIEQEVAEMVHEAFDVAKEAAEKALAIATDILQDTDKTVVETCDRADDGGLVEGASIKEKPAVEKALEMDKMAQVDDEIRQEVAARIVKDADVAAVETHERPDDSTVVVSAFIKQVPACISNYVLVS